MSVRRAPRRRRGPTRPALGIAAAMTVATALAATASGATSPEAAAAGGPVFGRGEQLTIDQLLAISHPSAPRWAPRGDRIAFLRERDGAVDLWWTSEEADEPVAVTTEAGKDAPGAVRGFCWSADGKALIYSLGGELHEYDLDSGQRRRLTRGAGDSGPVVSPDGRRLAFVRDGAVWVVSLPELEGGPVAEAAGALGTEGAGGVEAGGAFRDLQWSPDGAWLTALHEAGERVAEDTRALAGDKLEFWRRRRAATDLALIDAGGGFRWLERGGAYAGEAAFSAGGRLAWQEISADARQRRVLAAAPPDWAPVELVREEDPAWWTLTYLDAGPRWDPRGDRLLFVSERDGWAHLWLLGPAQPGVEPVQLTRGEFEVEAPAWSPSGDRIVVAANRGSLAERGLHLLDPAAAVGGRIPELVPISRLRGTSTAAHWRPDGARLAFLHADPVNPLDLWVQEPAPRPARQLTDSWPAAADEGELIAPQMVRYASSDGQLVPAELFLPPDHEAAGAPLPAIVWVHGGGIRQNRYGWHPMRAYALFYGLNQMLAQRGYVVLAVDYRGSSGYGRAWRQGQHLDLGGRDLDDVLAAIRYLRRNDEPSIGRIAVWGISYGGYLALQALVQAPTAFDAGIDVAGVADWSDWAVDPGGLWINGRMGAAEEHPELYRERSPVGFVDRLARPLLILHGTADSSVPVLESFRLVDALVAAGKPFDLMLYPGEGHVFARDRSWRDAFRRVEGFFAAHLR